MFVSPEVDAVFTWVNPNDSDFQKNLLKTVQHSAGDSSSPYASGACRFRDHQELRFSLRSISMYARFFRKIYVVCTGRPPDWLDLSGTQIVAVPVESLFPRADIAPTFSSFSIELFLHRIPGLSEHYVYFNDDFFISRPTGVLDFFDSAGTAKVRMEPRFGMKPPSSASDVYQQILWNTRNAIVDRLGDSLEWGWVDQLRRLIRGGAAWRFHAHAPQPFRKSQWGEFQSTFGREIEILLRHRFRSRELYSTNDLYHHLGRRLGTTQFVGVEECAAAHRVHGIQYLHQLKARLQKNDHDGIRFFCLNDGPVTAQDDWEPISAEILQALYPRPSPWERNEGSA